MSTAAALRLGALQQCRAAVPRHRRPVAARRPLGVAVRAQGESESGALGWARPTTAAAATAGLPPSGSLCRLPRLFACFTHKSGLHVTAEDWYGFQFEIHQYMPGYGLRPLAGVPSTLTLTEAYKALGLPEGSSYDEVLSAKNRLLEGAGNNMERKMEVRAGDGRAKHRHPRQQRRVWCST